MYYIGIDGGGTKSEYVLIKDDIIIAEALSTATNINSHGYEFVQKSIENGLKCLLSEQEIDGELYICLATAGVDQESDKIPYKKILQELGYPSPVIVNDAEAALSAGTKGEDGIIVIAGTGSIVFSKKDDQLNRAGGWGHMLGDEGSGYAIAIKGIKAVLNAFDGIGSETSLKAPILKEINAEHEEGFIDFIYKSDFNKDRIASLSKIVDQEATNGDQEAIKILNEEAFELSKQVAAVYKVFNNNPVKVVLNGSVIKHSKVFRKAFEEELKSYPLTFVDLDVSAALGAAYLARG